jgi:protocatechuate 3,4-dioxygenase beta subunit
MSDPPDDPGEHDHHSGLVHDLKVMARLADRRQALRLLAGASLVPLFGCSNDSAPNAMFDGARPGSDGAATPDTAASVDAGPPASCATIPPETEGPYPGDGSNGANALGLGGVVRSDIRSSLAPASGTAAGVPLTIRLQVVNANGGCAPLAGRAVYLWHCDREGLYSMYTLVAQNYLRGVQETDGNGLVTFTSIFPGCYPGRWPHVHFEIYPSLALATAGGNKMAVSQLALPMDACAAAYSTAGYAQSVTNLAGITLASDNVFSDGATLQVATVTGTPSAGYLAALTVGLAG